MRKHIPDTHVVNVIATIAMVVVTAGVVVVGIRGVGVTKKALELSERAWVSPFGAQLLLLPEKNKGIRFNILITNSGREPAADLNVHIQNSTIDAYDPELTDMAEIDVPKNTACDGLSPQYERFIVPPAPIGTTFTFALNSVHGDPAFQVDDGILNRTKFYVVRGCIAYVTYRTTHKTGFCYILEARVTPGTPAQAATATAPAQTAQPAQQAWVFTTCRTGFHAD